MTGVTIIMPTYNERDNIRPLIERSLAALAGYPAGAQILVVDDNSPDGTWQIVAELAAGDPRITLERRMTERGLTSAIWHGIRHAAGDIVVWMDCDLSMPPEDIPRLLAALEAAGADIAIGTRYRRGGKDVGHSLVGQAFSRAINLFAGLFLGFAISDYTTGFVAARRPVFDQITLRGDYGEYCIDFLHRARRRGFKIVEVPYACVERLAGESKTALNPWDYLRRGVKYVETILRLRFAS